MFEQVITDVLRAFLIYAVGFIVFLPFNFFMVWKNRDSTEAAMGDGKFQFTTKECVLISFLWPLCVLGIVLLTIGAVNRFFGRIFQPRSKLQSKKDATSQRPGPEGIGFSRTISMTSLLFAVVAVCLCGCNPNEGCVEVEGDIRVTRYMKESLPLFEHRKPTYVVIDGHEYLFVRYERGLGMTHSPKCSCVKKGKK